jgi:eukaryotic-like serine/threonine-protein kinase
MTPERLQIVERLYHSALACDADQRMAFLHKECGADEALRLEVEQLLSYAQRSGDFMESPVFEQLGLLITGEPGAEPHEPGSSMIGKRVAEYKIVAKIGSGGMGDVYRAVRADNEYQQLVAIKLVSVRDQSGQIVSRLRAERQILATLDHPNIARLLDGGTTEEGVPFFVMELIEGQAIDQYCAAHNLSVNDRLKLFLQVCSAVEYAHQHLIIHRDIKPANILVSADDVPKLLDFGIAKILGPEMPERSLDPTVTVVHALTPAYASPEQIKGEPITTASDVYSLGVTLYELLTGQHPHRKSGMSPHDVACAVCETEPEKPSIAIQRQKHPLLPKRAKSVIPRPKSGKLSQRLRGDLDTIVLMALRKEPARRYPSVDRLANDLRRHLKRVPVEARSDTFLYRASKFVARHRMGVAASFVAAVLLAVAVILIVREVRIARIERARAERRFNDVRTLANSLMFEIHDSIKDLVGATPARKLLVTRALEYLDSLSIDANGDSALQRELATAYEKVGNVQGNPRNANLGDTPGALKSFRKALAIRESLVADDPSNRSLQWELFGSYNLIGWVLQEQGDLEGALISLQQATGIARSISSESRDPRECDLIAGAHWGIATIFESKSDLSGALENYREAASIRKLAQNPTPKQAALLHTHLAADYQGEARVLAALGQTDAALQTQKQVTSLLEEQLQADSNNATLRKFLGDSFLYTGEWLQQKGDLGDALRNYRKAESIYADLSIADPANAWSRDWLGLAKVHLGDLLVREDKPNAALTSYRQASAIFEERSLHAPKDIEVLIDLAAAYAGMGTACERLLHDSHLSAETRLQDWSVARTCYQKSVERWESVRQRGALISKQRIEEADSARKGLQRCDVALKSLH